MVAYKGLKTTENFKTSASKVVAVAYKRCSLTRGSVCSDFTGEILVVWESCRLRERWSLTVSGLTGRFDCILGFAVADLGEGPGGPAPPSPLPYG